MVWPCVGVKLQAMDRCGAWLDATVISQRGCPDALNTWPTPEIKVHFQGWASTYDEWIPLDAERLLSADEDTPDQFAVERILKERKRAGVSSYLIRWVGFDASHDAWVAGKDIDRVVIQVHPSSPLCISTLPSLRQPLFNHPPPFAAGTILTPHTILILSALSSTNPLFPFPLFPKEFHDSAEKIVKHIVPTGPYVLSVEDSVAPDVADSLVKEWADDIGRKAAGLMARQREEFAGRSLFQVSPCPPWLVKALHRHCRLLAMTADPSTGVPSSPFPSPFPSPSALTSTHTSDRTIGTSLRHHQRERWTRR